MLRRGGGLAKPGRMIAGVTLTALRLIIVAGDQYIVIVLPAQPLAEVLTVMQDR